MTGLPYALVGPLLLLAAILFLAGELYKRMGLRRHCVPALLGATGVAISAAVGFLYGMRGSDLLFEGAVFGLLGAAVSVYGHQLCVQIRRSDRFQAPFKGFYFAGKGEGL